MATTLLALCATLIVFSASGANAQQQLAFKCADTGNSAVLADFYYSTNGHTSWGATTTGWSAAASGVKTSYCAFTGITCATSGDITRMCVLVSVVLRRRRANARVHISPAAPCHSLLVPRRAR
jgi:hypothetical protein